MSADVFWKSDTVRRALRWICVTGAGLAIWWGQGVSARLHAVECSAAANTASHEALMKELTEIHADVRALKR